MTDWNLSQEANMNYRLYKNSCGGCGKTIPTHATNRMGDLPMVFCSSPCETIYQNKQRFVEKEITDKYDNFLKEKQKISLGFLDQYDVTTGKPI